MGNWGVVVGVDDYSVEEAKLQGAVADALEVRKWLLRDPDGGCVPEDQLLLALGARRADQVAGLQAFPGTKGGAIDAINELIRRSGGKGERLFFYFAGHGIAVRESYSDVSALVTSDFTVDRPDNSVSLRSLWELFETLEFADQLLFVDACRNQPWPGETRLGHWPTPRMRALGMPTAQQFRLYATSPGLEAAELPGADGREGGAFTAALLQGLAGIGGAKEWNWRSQAYEVRWAKLCRFVRAEMEARRVKVAAGPVRQAFQIPQDEGTRGVAGREDDPVLASYPADRFGPEPLDILLAPTDVVPVATVVVRDDRGRVAAERRQIPGLPVRLELSPRRYAISAEAPEYDAAYADEPVELYAACEARLELIRSVQDAAPPAGAVPDGAESVAPAGSEGVLPGGGESRAPGATLSVACGDPLGPLEVVDGSGLLVEAGHGALELTGLPPGIYRVRLHALTGETVERTVELRPGEREQRYLQAPPPRGPALAGLLRDTPLALRPDNTVEVSETTGAIATPRLSTILALAGAAALRDGGPGECLRALGQQALQAVPADADAGLYVLAGVEAREREFAASELAAIRVRCWPLGAPVPAGSAALAPFSPAPGLGEHARATVTGPHWVSIERPDHEPLVFPVSLLPGRLAMLVIELSSPAAIRTYHYQPMLSPEASHDLSMMRKLEFLQRCELGQNLEAGHAIAAELLSSHVTDPIAGCLAGYLLLRLARMDELDPVVESLTTDFPELADGHVIAAECHAAAQRPDAAAGSIARAIEAGVPITGEGVTRLLDGLGEFRIDHKLARLVTMVHARYVHGSLWSVWTPERVTPGEQLVP